ncbi:MAG: RDD family protein [Bacteroidales bacterium]|nr:RDD family protein [Bacteroidales bacterium]
MEQQTTPTTTTTNMKYAGFGIRFVAYLLDAIIYFTIAYFIWGSSVANTSGGSASVSLNNEQLLIPLAYFLIFWLVFSSTPGKMLLGLKIVKADGSKIGIKEALLRILVYIVIFIGAWFILGNPKKQALHDMAAGTFVVKR